MTGAPKVAYGFVSFTEVEAGEHRSYNQWHVFDHMPEQFPLAGIVWGQRWVLAPALRPHLRASAPLDRCHYVTLYLLAEPIDDTLEDFFALARELRTNGRFHEHRTSHLSGPLPVRTRAASPAALVSPEAVPHRTNTGVHVRLTTSPDDDGVSGLLERAGVAGVWTFGGDDAHTPDALRGITVTWCWLDGDPAALAPQLATGAGDERVRYSATLRTVDPFGSWDWFD